MNIAIVGAGVIGRLTALQLIEQNHKVTVIDRHPLHTPDNAAWVSAGMLCPLGEIVQASPEVVDLGMKGLDLWPALLQLLTQQDPERASVFFQRLGSIAVSLPQDQSCLSQLHRDLASRATDYSTDIKTLSTSELMALEPDLPALQQGLHLRCEGQLDNRQFLTVSARAIDQHAHLVCQQISEDYLPGLCRDFDWVVDCRGAGAIHAKETNSAFATLRGIRGEVIRVICPEVTLTRPIRVLHPRSSIYIVPKPNHHFVIGATEIESHSDHPTTVRSTLELLSTLYGLHPGFAEAQVIESSVGIRAAYPNNEPAIVQRENRIIVNGLYRHGWLLGPSVTEKVVQSIKLGGINDHLH